MNTLFYVKKHPSPQSLYVALHSIPDGEDAGQWTQMTQAEIKEWSNAQLAGGWTPQDAAPVNEVPESVTPWQMLCALNQIGLRASVETAVAAADQNTKDAWNRATRFPRNSPLLAGVATSAGMTDAQLDDLFRLAATFQ